MIELESSLAEDACGLTENDKEEISKLTVPVPDYENDRIKILRQTKLLDSDEDVSFDRFTALSQRIFNVPIALVSLVDVNRQWFKSSIGLDASETHRNDAFCSYTVLPDSPEVLVVADALKDSRFATNPLVTGSPFIRFYAGAALIVAGVRVGSLCIIDRVPHEEFDIKDRMNLLDLGEAISILMRMKRESELNLDKARMQVVIDTVSEMRPSITSLGEGLAVLQSQRQILGRALQEQGIPENGTPASNVEEAIAKIDKAYRKLTMNMHQAASLGDAVLQSTGKPTSEEEVASEEFVAATASGCNLMEVVTASRQKLIGLQVPAKVKWMIDSSQLSEGGH